MVLQGFSCFAGNPVYVGVPGQVTGDINPQISCTGNSFQDLAMKTVICIYRFPGPCHL